MDPQSYWAIAEADIEIQNPITDRKLRLLDDYCDIRDGLKVLDIGCGKAWLMRQWADRFAIEGTGIDHNRAFLEHARARPPARGRLEFIETEAEAFRPAAQSFDVILCLGTSFALGGFPQAVEWMAAAARPGASLVIGDLTTRHRPTVNTHQHMPLDPVDLMGVVQRHGAEVSAVISASDADFERYMSHHRHATLRWARENPDHPDADEVLQRSQDEWTHYLRTMRPHLGWTIFVGRKPG